VRACRQAFDGDPARTPNTHLSVSLRVFASLREANEAQTPSPQRQSAGRQSQRADLALESTSYLHSCPFVSIRGSTSPLRFLRVFASSRETNSPPPPPRSGSPQTAGRRGQISRWKARATCIRVHSWFIRQAVESHPWSPH
jgi:hypothetical protein